MILFKIWEGFVEVFGVDVREDLPEDLAVLELSPGGDSASEVECVELEKSMVSTWLRACSNASEKYPVKESLHQLRLEVVHGADWRGSRSAESA